MNTLVFEDSAVSRLHPITTGRPAFAITCATYRLIDWLAEGSGPLAAFTRPHIRDLVRADFPQIAGSVEPSREWTLLVNARLAPTVGNLDRLREFAARPEPGRISFGQSLAAALVPTPTVSRLDLFSEVADFENAVRQAVASLPEVPRQLELFDFPHEVLRSHLAHFSDGLNRRLQTGDYRQIADGVFVSGGVTISDFVVTNTRMGPIVIEDDAAIGPFCFLRGPIHIGPQARVNEYAAIKDAVSIGHTTKIGGEVESSIIEPYTNKQHHGFLGHSYLGSWINLGAGTCNSDLKNTYGEVKMDYGSERVATGMQFIGCIVGDYAKTAINTSIFTGKTIGACSMVYGFVTTNVPSFVNYARSFGQITESPPAVMELTQRRMFQRRNVQQRPVDIQLLTSMYDLTRHERQMSEEPLSL